MKNEERGMKNEELQRAFSFLILHSPFFILHCCSAAGAATGPDSVGASEGMGEVMGISWTIAGGGLLPHALGGGVLLLLSWALMRGAAAKIELALAQQGGPDAVPRAKDRARGK